MKINGIEEIKDLSIRKINEKFGVFGKQSKDFVQYPGNWSIFKFGRLKNNEGYEYDKEDFWKICEFKLQDYMMTELLGLDTNFVFLVRKGKESEEPGKPRVVHWKTVFNWLDLDDLPYFAAEMVRKISEEKK